MSQIPYSELILNADNSVYHLNLKDDNIANTVILVGDQNRVEEVSKHFNKIYFKTSHREFITHHGSYKGKDITVLSTGIGTDNIDIVLNELDAAINIDPLTRQIKKIKRTLTIFRLGTSGAIQPDIPVNSLLASSHGLGLDGLLNYYANLSEINESTICADFITQTGWSQNLPLPYCISANEDLLSHIGTNFIKGITATAPGFYAPQGRELRLKPFVEDLNKKLEDFRFDSQRITNFEMETSALYGLGKLLNHRCLTICVIIANRLNKEFTENYEKSIEHLIQSSLNFITSVK